MPPSYAEREQKSNIGRPKQPPPQKHGVFPWRNRDRVVKGLIEEYITAGVRISTVLIEQEQQ